MTDQLADKKRRGRPRLAQGDGREDIKRAALAEFAKRGFKGASVEQIARTAGVAKPLIHYHFGSKDKLWKQAVSEAYEEFREEAIAFALSLGQHPIEEALDTFAEQIVQFAADRVALIQISIDETRQGGLRAEWLKSNYLVPLQKIMVSQVLMVFENHPRKETLASHFIPSLFGAIVFPFVDADVMSDAHGIDVFTKKYVLAQAELIKVLLKACLELKE